MKRRKRWIVILIAVIGLIDILGLNYLSVINTAKARFAVYQEKAKTFQANQGIISYIDEGTGTPVLVCHGICGGYDQGFDVLKDKTNSFRINYSTPTNEQLKKGIEILGKMAKEL